MRRVLVPLDGSPFAAAILPDAKQLAGKGGEIILVGDPLGSAAGRGPSLPEEGEAVSESLAALEEQADRLRKEGIMVETHVLLMTDPAYAIQSATRLYDADMVACSTHGRSPLGRLRRGGVAWRVLTDSPVPVLVRHTNGHSLPHVFLAHGWRIMVPLDGSARAERALPLARELAAEWKASIWLVHVVSHHPISGLPATEIDPEAATDAVARRSAEQYLDRIAAGLSGEVRTHVLVGPVAEHLIAAVQAWEISHVVLTSHGRTGLARVMLGSVTDELLQHLACPIIVVPAHESSSRGEQGEPASATL